ncbi:MAG TPA: vWA domain-containing protein [Microlunatus sp.]
MIATALLTACLVSVGAPTPAAAATPDPNPTIAKECGLDITLVLDASGSVQSSKAVEQVRDAAEAFLDALADTGSTARVIQFASLAEVLAPRAVVTTPSLDEDAAFGRSITRYYNPIPPRPSDVEIKRFNGGSITAAGSFSSSNGSNQYTNWDQVLDLTEVDPGDLVVFITDGDPTAYDFNRPGDPFSPGPPPDVAVGTDGSSAAATSTLDRAVEEANAVKAKNARVLALGVGNALQNQASVNRLIQVSGPTVADSFAEFDIETTDVALIRDFDDLADAVRSLVLELCSPSLTIRKFAQTDADANYEPRGGWDFEVTPTVTGGTFDWILPSGATGPSWTLTTNADGFAQFQWEPDPADATSSALVEEAVDPGYVPGRPGENNDFHCEAKNADGDTRVIEGDLNVTGDTASFTLTPIEEEIVTCSVYNSFDYAPAIAITKVNTPTEVRGDLTPPAEVRSTYAVTNPGNTPLDKITVVDDKCAPVEPVPASGPNVGDIDDDLLLDPGEEWQFTCDREARVSRRLTAAVNVVNTVDVLGVAPDGQVVTDDATDDVDLFFPAVQVTKVVNGEEAVTVETGTDVTYAYEVTNTGNTPLGSVTLADDTPPCEEPVGGPEPGDDDILALGEVWTYSCTAEATQSVINTATVTGTPLNPNDDNAAFPDPNPVVTDQDPAQVTVVDPGLALTKTVDEDLVFPGTTVTYSYTATNDGDTDLRNDTGEAGWVTDDQCSPVEQVLDGDVNVGDANSDDLMNPDETWEFTCTAEINELTVNVATIVAQPVVGGQPVGEELTRRANELVDVIEPGIEVTKLALVGVVLDPDADPIAGPDTPDPRPAEYLYEVTNTGTAPIADVELTDDICPAVTFVSGDENTDDILDVDEVWTYTCSTPLQRQQGNTPPLPPGSAISGLVQNTATVTGTPFLPDDPGQTTDQISDNDIAQVTVIEPGLQLTKEVSASVVRADGEVTYTFSVTNTGDVGLEIIGPIDDKCADLTFTGDDRGDNGLLEGANTGAPETWTYTCTRAIGLPPEPETIDTNTASVGAVDPLGNYYVDTASAEVRVISPAIDLVKTVSESLVPAGTEVTYGFDVTNVGTSPVPADDLLADVDLVDVSEPPTPNCLRPQLVSKVGGNQDDFLDRVPAETWRYECAAEITDPTTDIAVVGAFGGTQFDLRLFVFDIDAAFVQPFRPGIEVDKTADPTEVEAGEEVTYTYRVRNTGDVPLADVADRITDDTCSPVTYVSGDTDGDGLLDTPTSIFEDAADETWVFTCVRTIDETTTNVVTVTGTPTDPGGTPLCGTSSGQAQRIEAQAIPPCDTSDTDQATVEVTEEPTPESPSEPSSDTARLPNTGSDVPGWALVAGPFLLAVGSALLIAGRRQRG